MKYITLSVLLLLACISSGNAFAKKKTKDPKQDQVIESIAPVSLATEVDTLSYAYGSMLSERGLEQYLYQAGVLADTISQKTKFEEQINKAGSEAEKLSLNQKMNAELDSIKIANKASLIEFLKGVKEKLNSNKKVNLAYEKGLEIGGQLVGMSEKLSTDAYGDSGEKLNNLALYEGMKDFLSNQPQRVEDGSALVEKMMQKAQEKKYSTSIEAGKKFMSDNAVKEGVISLPSGLQYKIITQGNGEKPTISDKVKVHYKGSFIDGTVFDSSIERGEPLTFGLDSVIKGWTEVLQLMPVGSKWEVYIPYDLAYGEADRGTIKPYSNLIFEIELLEIVK